MLGRLPARQLLVEQETREQRQARGAERSREEYAGHHLKTHHTVELCSHGVEVRFL